MLLLPKKKEDNGFTQNLRERLADSDSLVRTGFSVLEHDQNMPVSKSKANILLCNNGERKKNIYEDKKVQCYAIEKKCTDTSGFWSEMGLRHLK